MSRRRGARRIARIEAACNCEHTNHFTRTIDGRKVARVAHRYMTRPAGKAWCMYVGHVCDACADSCVKDYIIPDHVCGEGDCRRVMEIA